MVLRSPASVTARVYFCTYLLDLETRQLRLVLDTPNPDWDLSYSPDGNWLAVEAEGQAQDYQVHLISTPGGQALRLEMDGKPLNARQVCWSPDSSSPGFCFGPGWLCQHRHVPSPRR